MIPKKRPIHPGELIKEDILNEFKMSQKELADKLGVSRRTVNEIVNGKRGLSAEMAVRIALLTKTSPEVWLNLQNAVDLWDALQNLKSFEAADHAAPSIV